MDRWSDFIIGTYSVTKKEHAYDNKNVTCELTKSLKKSFSE